MHRHVRRRAQPAFKPGKHALDQAVKPDGGEIFAAGLHAHPAVVVEDVGFLAEGVDDVHQRPGLVRHEPLNEIHVVPLVSRGRPVGGLQLSAVDEVLRRQGVAVFLPEGVQRRGAYRKVVAGPVGKPGSAPQIAAEDPYEIIEQRGQPDHVRLRVILAPDPQPVLQILPSHGMPRIQLPQVLALPVVGGMVVHVDLFPDAPCQEGHGIPVVGRASPDGDRPLPQAPVLPGHLPPRRPVPDLPVPQGLLRIVQLELLLKIALQGPDLGLPAPGNNLPGKQEGLLLRLGMLQREFVVFPDDADGGIDAVSRLRDLGAQLCAVAVPDHVRAPSFRHFQGQLLITGLAGQREISLQERIHPISPPFYI